MSSLSEEFKNIWLNENRSIDVQQYEYCLDERKAMYEKKAMSIYIIAIILFSLGLWALYENSYFVAIFLTIIAANFKSKSDDYMVLAEIMDMQRLLAMFINKQILDTEIQEK
jgi:hypothetical protein